MVRRRGPSDVGGVPAPGRVLRARPVTAALLWSALGSTSGAEPMTVTGRHTLQTVDADFAFTHD